MKIAALALIGAMTAGSLLAQAQAQTQSQTQTRASQAQEVASAISAAEARTTAEDFAEALEQDYVFPDIGKRYAAALREKAASGAYDGLGTAATFAQRVTEDLRAVSPDNHLRLMFDAPPGPGADPAARRQDNAPAARSSIKPIEDARWIAPGIAYVRFNVFPPDAAVTKEAAAFMAAHAEAKALIFDVRTHRGGGLDQMDAIFPYLFEKPTPLVSMDTRASVDRAHGSPLREGPTLKREVAGDEVVRRVHSVIPHATERRLFGAKVFVLTSGVTASAAEHFTLSLKRTGRATLIGEPTAGAGHFGGTRPVGARFSAFVPVGRTFDPDTGRGWEGAGIAPDVAVPASQALAQALIHAGLAKAEAERIAAGIKIDAPMERRRPRA
jgi:hypothetical protein